MKRYPLILSAAGGVRPKDSYSKGSVRFPFHVTAPITRWRLHIRNFNDRFNIAYPSGAAFTGVWVGEHAGEGRFRDEPQRVATGFTLPGQGREHVTNWFTAPLGQEGGGRERLISLGWRHARAPITRSVAGCYASRDPAAAGRTDGASFSKVPYVPFSWWIEIETPADVRAVAMWGDSLTAGTGNNYVIHDSPLSQYCRRIGAIPIHYCSPGSGMIMWTSPSGAQWTKWSELSPPASVVHFMGQNDLRGAGDLAGMQQRYSDTLENLRVNVCERVLVATLTPSSNKSEQVHSTRLEYNQWLTTQPGGVQGTLDFATAVVDRGDGRALAAEFDCGDHLHLSTAGSTALADVLSSTPLL